jgi:hypothetical protein
MGESRNSAFQKESVSSDEIATLIDPAALDEGRLAGVTSHRRIATP